MKHRAKIAIVRGPGLSKWEMQIYEPLGKYFDLMAIGSTQAVNDYSRITFPVIHLPSVPQFISSIPYYIPCMFRTFGDTQWMQGFEKTIGGYDLIHSVEVHNGFSLQAVRAKQKGLVKRVTLTIYENIPFLYRKFPRRYALTQEVYAHTDHFFAINEMSRQMLLLDNVPKEKISIIPQSVDTSVFHPLGTTKKDIKLQTTLRAQFGIPAKSFVVLAVARMVWEKGWYDLIAAAAKIKKETTYPIVFLCVGEGPEKRTLLELVKSLQLTDCILFTGFRPYRGMADIFRVSDVFCYPSLPTPIWNAQFGGVLIEALASGLPVVGTLAGGTRDDTVGEGGGIFVQPQHFSALADAIIHLYTNQKLIAKIKRRNRLRALTKYSTTVVAGQIRQVWEEQLGRVH